MLHGVHDTFSLLRCTPPPCIAALAEEYDDTIVNSAWDKLEIRRSEVTDESRRILTTKLTYGGFGIIPTLTTSPGAYLGSVTPTLMLSSNVML